MELNQNEKELVRTLNPDMLSQEGLDILADAQPELQELVVEGADGITRKVEFDIGTKIVRRTIILADPTHPEKGWISNPDNDKLL